MTEHLLFAGTHGHVIAIDKRNGDTVWETSLPSTGYSVVSIVLEDDLLFCASGGLVFALDPTDGGIVWENPMPGMGRGIVYLTTQRSSQPGGMTAMAQAARNAQQSANAAL